MAKRTGKEKTTHDRKVRRVASEYKKRGYNVQASSGRYPEPDPIGYSKRVPDVMARKGSKVTIVEVETPRSLKTDKDQLQTFARYAAKHKDVDFDIVVTKPRKTSTSKKSTGGKSRKT